MAATAPTLLMGVSPEQGLGAPLVGASMFDVDGVNITAELASINEQIAIIKENMDVFFLLIISFIVFFLQAGFAFLEVGAVRSKNATNILIKNMLDVFIGGISFWLIGYPLAFGKGNGFFGTTFWASAGLPDLQLAHWFFQFVFAATAATIVSGSVAERCAFNAYLIYSVTLTGFIYPIIAHWTWSDDGWLAATAYHDFAGSGVVHVTGGVSALLGAIMLGPRIGRFGDGAKKLHGHSVPLAGLGGFILLFGFLAFNGGSQGSISNPGDAAAVARAVVNTIISGCSGGICVLCLFKAHGGCTWSFLNALNGSLAGMVCMCAGCDVYRPWGACIIGTTSGFVFLGVHKLMIKLKVDDPLDAVAVHMGGGILGLLSVGIFMDDGILYGGQEGLQVLLWNVVGMLTIVAWAGGLCLIMFGSMKMLNILRVPPEVEIKGMDILKHGEPAYPVEAWIEEQYNYTQADKALDIPAHMKPPPRKALVISNSQLAGFYPHHPHYWSLHERVRRHSMPQHTSMMLDMSPPGDTGSLSKRKYKKVMERLNEVQRNGGAYFNEAMEMETNVSDKPSDK